MTDKFAEIRTLLVNSYELMRQGRSLEAKVLMAKASQIDPVMTTVCMGEFAALAGRFPEAISLYDAAIDKDPFCSIAWCDKGAALNQIGYFSEAVECFKRAIEINPIYARAMVEMGIVLYNLGNAREAISFYQKAINVDPNYADAWLNKGLALDECGQFDEAITSYDMALRINYRDKDALYNKGVALFALGRLAEAKQCYESVLNIDPNHNDARFNYNALSHVSIAKECPQHETDHKTWNESKSKINNVTSSEGEYTIDWSSQSDKEEQKRRLEKWEKWEEEREEKRYEDIQKVVRTQHRDVTSPSSKANERNSETIMQSKPRGESREEFLHETAYLDPTDTSWEAHKRSASERLKDVRYSSSSRTPTQQTGTGCMLSMFLVIIPLMGLSTVLTCLSTF